MHINFGQIDFKNGRSTKRVTNILLMDVFSLATILKYCISPFKGSPNSHQCSLQTKVNVLYFFIIW